MLKNYLKTAFRNLFHSKAYSIINIGGLSLGLACAILIILYVKDEVSYDRFHNQVGQIYRIDREITRDNGNKVQGGYSGYFQGPRFKARIPEIAAFVRVEQAQADMKRGTTIQTQAVVRVDSNFFSVFNFPLLSGTTAGLKDPRSVIITEDLAKAQFGTIDAVGKTISFREDSTFVPYLVTGVSAKCPENSSIKFQVLFPLNMPPAEENKNDNWFHFFLNTFVVLSPNANPRAVDAKMQQVFETDGAESIRSILSQYNLKKVGITYFLQPLTDIHLSTNAGANEGLSDGSDPIYSYVLSGIAIFILLIACINFVNLTVARSLKRAKEIGIRKVIGGGRKQLILQFLGESLLLCLAAFVVALGVAYWVLPVFNQLSNKALSFSYLFDARLVAGYIALFFVTGLLAGLYPAFVLSNYQPVQTLYGRFMPAGKNWLQKSLIVFQFVLASFLIVATLTLFFQLNFMSSQKLGYDDRNLVIVGADGMSLKEAELFKSELAQIPSVVGVAPKNAGTPGNTVEVNKEKTKINISVETIDENYLPLLNIPIVDGRNFSAEYPGDSAHSVLINETFVKEAGWKDPVGQFIHTYGPGGDLIVVGVVKDFHYKPLTEKIAPQLFTKNTGNGFGMFYIKIAPNSEAKSLSAIEGAFKKTFPLAPYAYDFKDQVNARSYEAEQKWKQMVFFGATLTIFISCIGLFGLSVLSTEKRAKEMGIRKVLGASVANVVATLSGDFLRLIVIALTVSVPISWVATNKWLETYPYRITMTWWMFASAGMIVILVSMATVSIQSIRAAIGNPIKSLRTE